MKYAVWFVRLIFAAWMIPAGLNHFVTLFPQPLGTQPLSQELFLALFDSHLFDLVKLVDNLYKTPPAIIDTVRKLVPNIQ